MTTTLRINLSLIPATKNVAVVFDPKEPEHYKHIANVGDWFVFLGEIQNMLGHGLFFSQRTGKQVTLHIENFWFVLEEVDTQEKDGVCSVVSSPSQ